MKTKLIALSLLIIGITASAQVNMEFVSVGNPGNPNDYYTGYGGVGYTYAIGKCEVTLNQYTAFLNAVASTSDPYGLYNPSMATDLSIAGIQQTLVSGNYYYSVIGSGNHPVAYVSWFDAARFTNWLHNGQPTGIGEVPGSTEDGAYTLLSSTSGIVLKNAHAQYWIPSENEWYKAAYYDPVSAGADASGTPDYWLYPTQSDSVPDNFVGAGTNSANYYAYDYCVTQSVVSSSSQNYLTDVGTFTQSASHYGTFDQGGNVWEWNDAVIDSSRGLRGGSWTWNEGLMRSSLREHGDPASSVLIPGFRVATVPEPSSIVLLGAGVLSLAALRRRAR